jgi:MerR family copper efflux transcriptional regulator
MRQGAISVGQAARLAGLSPKAVRLYEAVGILIAVERTPSGYRTYTADHVELLRFVRRARALGLSLTEIQRVVEAGRREASPCGSVVELLERHIRATSTRIEELTQIRMVLAGLLEDANDRGSRGQPVRLCRLVSTADVSPVVRG